MPRLNVFPRFRQWWHRHRGQRDDQPKRDRHESDDGHRVTSILGVLLGQEPLDIPQFFPGERDWRERYRHGWIGDDQRPGPRRGGA